MTTRPSFAAFLVLGLAGPLLAQQAGPEGREAAPGSTDRFAWARPVASLLVPGSGQLLAGQDRGAVYLAAEAFLVSRFVSLTTEGRRERDRFRELALTVARRGADPTTRDTAFAYFEQLVEFVESGPFDTDSGPALVPPTDERTYNGSVWALARRTFFVDPDSLPDPESEAYTRALEFYREHAVGPNFEWSWRNAGLEQDLFRTSIRQSDEAFRRATQHLGLLLVNHLISAIDAFISYRLSTPHRRIGVRSVLLTGPGARGLRWLGAVSVEF